MPRKSPRSGNAPPRAIDLSDERHRRSSDESGAAGKRRTERYLREVGKILDDLDLPDPGTLQPRRGRWEEVLLLGRLELLKRHPELSEERARTLVERMLNRRDPKYQKELVKQLDRISRTSVTARRSRIKPAAEMHAVLRLVWFRWLWEWLARNLDGGRPAQRGRPLSLLFYMSWSTVGPVVQAAWDKFEGSFKLGWVFCWRTEGPSPDGCYDALRVMTDDPRKDPAVLQHINAAIIRRFVAQRMPDGEPAHPDAFKYLVIDGKGIKAHIRQSRPKGKDAKDPIYQAHERQMQRHRRRARYGIHKHGVRVVLQLFGYKLMTLSTLRLGKTLVWDLYPFAMYEPDCIESLLRKLHQLYPEHAPDAEYLVADALYDTNVTHRMLWKKWSIHLVCHEKTDDGYREDMPFWERSKVPGGKGDLGVPECRCGLMKRTKPDGFVTAAHRVARGIPFGAEVAQSPRLRWVCPNGRCPARTTRPLEYPRLYTYLPRAGTHATAALREALLLRRNEVESQYHLIQYFGLEGEAPLRAAWATDRGMEWLIGLILVYISARRWVHANGDYKRSLAEAEKIGALEWPTPDNPRPGPVDLRVIEEARRERLEREGEEDLMPPPSWLADHPEDTILRGYYKPAKDIKDALDELADAA
jgi:hypothetical protein